MAERVDVAVVGGGLMGAAAAWAAARRGLSVALHEQFEPGHTRGSSHGSARIVRRGYSDALYTRLTRRGVRAMARGRARGRAFAYFGWSADWITGRTAPRWSRACSPRPASRTRLLAAADAEARWPGMHFAGPVVYHPQAGTMDADRAVAALLDLARRAGATIQHGSRVAAVEPVHDEYAAVRLADGRELEARCAVVAAGAWVEPLLDGQLKLPPLTVTQQQVFHFPRRDEAAPPWPSRHPPGRDGDLSPARWSGRRKRMTPGRSPNIRTAP